MEPTLDGGRAYTMCRRQFRYGLLPILIADPQLLWRNILTVAKLIPAFPTDVELNAMALAVSHRMRRTAYGTFYLVHFLPL